MKRSQVGASGRRLRFNLRRPRQHKASDSATVCTCSNTRTHNTIGATTNNTKEVLKIKEIEKEVQKVKKKEREREREKRGASIYLSHTQKKTQNDKWPRADFYRSNPIHPARHPSLISPQANPRHLVLIFLPISLSLSLSLFLFSEGRLKRIPFFLPRWNKERIRKRSRRERGGRIKGKTVINFDLKKSNWKLNWNI